LADGDTKSGVLGFPLSSTPFPPLFSLDPSLKSMSSYIQWRYAGARCMFYQQQPK